MKLIALRRLDANVFPPQSQNSHAKARRRPIVTDSLGGKDLLLSSVVIDLRHLSFAISVALRPLASVLSRSPEIKDMRSALYEYDKFTAFAYAMQIKLNK